MKIDVFIWMSNNTEELWNKYAEQFQIEDGWFIGESYGRRGLFPSNYVEIIQQKEEKKVMETKNVEEVSEASDDGLSAVALYDYQATEDGELSFDPEDIITNIEKVRSFSW